MDIVIVGIIAYIGVLFLFTKFGRFLKDCDNQVKEFKK